LICRRIIPLTVGIPPVAVQRSKKVPKWVFFYFFVHRPISLYIKCRFNYTNIPGCIKTISDYIFPEIATKSNRIRFNTFPVYISRPYLFLSDVVHFRKSFHFTLSSYDFIRKSQHAQGSLTYPYLGHAHIRTSFIPSNSVMADTGYEI